MNRFTPVVAGLLLLSAYPISAQDISVEDTVNFDLRAIGQTQGAGVPRAAGARGWARRGVPRRGQRPARGRRRGRRGRRRRVRRNEHL